MDAASFPPGDPADPRNWSAARKWSVILVLLPIDMSVSWAASGFSPASEDFIYEFEVPTSTAILGLSLFVLGQALGPLCLAPLSEYFGRKPVYIWSYGLFLCMLLATAVAETPRGFLALRLLSGMFGSATLANVGGTIADLWPPDETGPPMALFVWGLTAGSPSGYLLFSWVAEPHGVRSVFWALLGICLAFWLLMLLGLRETRHSALLRRRAHRQLARRGRQTVLRGKDLLRKVEANRGVWEFCKQHMSRPLIFLFTEPPVLAAALVLGYLFGLSFLLNQAFTMAFGYSRGFPVTRVGAALLGPILGLSLGALTHLYQERRYRRDVETVRGANNPEARAHLAKLAALLLPLAMHGFAWTAAPSSHFLLPIAASLAWYWAFYTLVLMLALWLVDAYGAFAASVLAAVGLVRYLGGAGFPLFAARLWQSAGYELGGSWLALACCALAPVPFVLSEYGGRLRAWSRWARCHGWGAQGEVEPEQSPLKGHASEEPVPVIEVNGVRKQSVRERRNTAFL